VSKKTIHGVRSIIVILAVTAVSSLTHSCTGSDTPPDLVVEPSKTVSTAAPDSAEAMLTRLDKKTARSEKLSSLVKDVRLMLEAMREEEAKNLKGATAKWFEAAVISEGAFGDHAIKNWVRTYAANLDKKVDELVMAKLLLAETRGGFASPHMTVRGLTNEAAMAVYIRKVIPEFLDTPPPTTTQSDSNEKIPSKGIPGTDPLLNVSAKAYCGLTDQAQKDEWAKWVQGFSANIKGYWDALILDCSGKPGEALASFGILYAKLAETKDTQNLAAAAVSRAVTLQRQMASRESAADTYNEVVKIWQLPGVNHESMGMSKTEFQLERVNLTLWAARYRALIGDYENAKLHSQGSLNQIANVYSDSEKLDKKAKDTLAEYRAEAYHILSYRIAVENQDFEGALSLNLLALQTPGLNEEWNDRLTWFAGLYDYLAGNFESSKKRWENLLNKTKDTSMKPMIFFWLARAYDKLGQAAESRFYLSTIAEDYPLSFYATVAPTIANMVPDRDWREVFGNLQQTKSRLASGDSLNIEKLRASPQFGRLLLRSEILNAAQIQPFTVMSVVELERKVTSDSTAEAAEDLLTYISRLYFVNGEFLKNIALTTKLATDSGPYWKRHPEQIFVYFPAPYTDIYERSATENAIDRNVLLAVSRQESGFTKDIKSGANAIGLMQLIPPTAKHYAEELGLETTDISQKLLNPEFNVRLGSRYLKKLTLQYKGFFPAIFGGYNGGETAMDIWMKRRYHADPLVFVELIPFNETKGYVKNVWRNLVIYNYLNKTLDDSSSVQMTPDREGLEKFHKFDHL
jgi:soluble lytic murein transglycosylase-like protein